MSSKRPRRGYARGIRRRSGYGARALVAQEEAEHDEAISGSALVLMTALVLSSGTTRLLAECYMSCEMWVTPSDTKMECEEVWCD